MKILLFCIGILFYNVSFSQVKYFVPARVTAGRVINGDSSIINGGGSGSDTIVAHAESSTLSANATVYSYTVPANGYYIIGGSLTHISGTGYVKMYITYTDIDGHSISNRYFLNQDGSDYVDSVSVASDFLQKGELRLQASSAIVIHSEITGTESYKATITLKKINK